MPIDTPTDPSMIVSSVPSSAAGAASRRRAHIPATPNAASSTTLTSTNAPYPVASRLGGSSTNASTSPEAASTNQQTAASLR